MKIYEFLHCDCIHESSYATISVHRTKKGAFKAMNKFINEEFMLEYYKRITYGKNKKNLFCGAWKFGKHAAWTVGEIELLD